MAATLPPDPYLALGVSKDADAATIKSTYRKLALKCHPDKVTDESLKKQKQEEFHKIQQAYEILCDDEKRKKYDAEVRFMEKLRNERGPQADVKAARYETRTAAPAGASFGATGAGRYEERRPRSYEDDRYFEDRAARKYDTYEAYPRASRSSREKESSRSTKASTDRTRSERTKTRDREERRERSGKFVYVEDDSSSTDEKARYESDYRRRSDDDRRRHDEDEIRRKAAEDRRKAEERRSYEEAKEPRRHRSGEAELDRQRKLSELEQDAVRYIHLSRVEAEARPSASRASSSRDTRPDPYESRSSRPRPDTVRRSSARPRDRPSSSGRDSHRDRRGVPEIVDWEEERRAPPSFKHSSSSPAEIHIPRATPQRSHTDYPDGHRGSTSPTPQFRRSETMPTVPSSSSSRRKEASARPSGLRTSETADLPPFTEYPSVPPPLSTKYYHYPTPGGGVSLRPEDVTASSGHRTVLHEPSRYRARSPSPLSRPPMGANRPAVAEPVRMTSSSSSSAIPPPPLGRSSSRVSPTRGRGERLYGEISPDALRRERERERERESARHQTKFDKVSYAPKIGPEDIRWSASRGRETEKERGDGSYTKPSLSRYATYVY
ncbi:DnaJ-domain-containing protein [Westerdykella ornata]|uniref:DnaJ-domain-containing protein n=1 Tax=Westerdykella ornata TaxID=318751 RepID=A0A6A6JGJ5_WESOR|nr:DnaJ-domain-containing protein [Westerdykella ornata]KAF2275098.1 DnaJ-domain-containing protein [Westerdykella ornata]